MQLPIREGNGVLAAQVPAMAGYSCIVDVASGLYIAKLPTPEEGYRILCHPASKVISEKVFADGTVEIIVRRR